MPLVALASCRRSAAAPAARRPRSGAGGAAGRRRVLRVRRHVRGQERGHVGGDADRQAAPPARHGSRGVRVRRQLVPDAHRGRPAARARGGSHHAPRRGTGGDRMSGGFPRAAAAALQDSQLRHNLGAATATIRAKRAAVVDERPDWQQLRDAGGAIKQRALVTLPEQLERLEVAVAAAGGEVHWARDAVEANAAVAAIARRHGADELIKVKSMATEEIGLNAALRAEGINALETDLAELIVQLAHDRPSHILVPAIHRNREEIRDLFSRTIARDEQVTSEPAALTEAARLFLREKFLSARVAVSGANFAVAETGAVCVVESEGNGRFCTTLPDVLVTVMGIEKVLAEWRDLEVMLQLLPRSSTGERMNPYTSLWTGVSEGDGPREFHLVLLDNGRTEVLADPVGRQALHCIRCSACLNSCPVYSRTGGHAYESVYPGPIGAILAPQLHGLKRSSDLPWASSLCGACYEVCPVKIDIPSVLVHLRGRVVRERRSGSRIESALMRALARFAIGPLARWTEARQLPEVPEQSFRDWWRARA